MGGVKLEHRIWPWLVEMVGWMMSRADVGVANRAGAYKRERPEEPMRGTL